MPPVAATFISEEAGTYNNAPGCYTDAQVAAWKRVVDAVHAKGCFIYLQLWALGRAADPAARGALDIVSASDIPFEGGATPRPLSEAEIKAYPGMYARAAANFVQRAGGDGVEIHGANGYLIDQFLQTVSNKVRSSLA
jgi:NADPH2 dehydrogenase